jgi:alcohol dehydrogenase
VCGTDHVFVNGDSRHVVAADADIRSPGRSPRSAMAEDFAVGDRVAVGWFGGTATGACPAARANSCNARPQVPSLNYPAGTRSRSSCPGPRWPASPTSCRSWRRHRWDVRG